SGEFLTQEEREEISKIVNEEQEKAELLEQNILEVMEKIVSGVDYWEDTKQIELRKYITRILLDYSLREQQNNPQIVASKNQLQKELKEKIKEGTKPSELKKIKQDGGEHNILDNID
ncbi:2812_t:CDS:2, partial [Ambispora leptoticha]